MTKWNYGVFFLNFSHVGQQEPSLTINNALETLRIMDEDTSIYDVVTFSEHHIDKSYNDETKLPPFVSPWQSRLSFSHQHRNRCKSG